MKNFMNVILGSMFLVAFTFQPVFGQSLWEESGDDVYYDYGYVGIGTDLPSAPLTVYSSTTLVKQKIQNSSTGITDNDGLEIYMSGLNMGIHNHENGVINFATNDTNVMVIDATGKVGIGTDSPSAPLTVYRPNSLVKQKIQNNTGKTELDGLEIYMSGPNAGIHNYENGVLKFATNGDNRMVIDASGNVGIGTDDPKSSLHVTGLQEYADNAAAIAGGLTVGALYRTGDLLKIVH